jgi:antitoxin (DNA-binding transcriptional repressor) of toxin-antitoxin stability system
MRAVTRRSKLILWSLVAAAVVTLVPAALAWASAAGTITTFAGGGTDTASGIPATKAKLSGPTGVAFDRKGDLLIGQYGDGLVSLVAASSCSSKCAFGLKSLRKGHIYTVAGGGKDRYTVNGVPAKDATLSLPGWVAVDRRGDLVITDQGDAVVRLVAASSCSSGCPFGLKSLKKGYIYTVAGDGTRGNTGNGGPATKAELYYPAGLAVGASGDLLVTDGMANVIRLVAASSCSSGCPFGLKSLKKGYIYTVAGGGSDGPTINGVPAIKAKLSGPRGGGVDGRGDLLIADAGNSVVQLVAVSDCSSACPYGLKSLKRGDIYTVAGGGKHRYTVNAVRATQAKLSGPKEVAVDAGGNLLIADTLDSVVRMVAASSCSSGCPYGLKSLKKGYIYTVAGDGTYGYTGNGGPATKAELAYPEGLATNGAGRLLIADNGNNVVRSVTGGP